MDGQAQTLDSRLRLTGYGPELLTAIAEGTFGVTKRPPDGGRGLDGVVQRAEGYFNPAASMLEGAGERS